MSNEDPPRRYFPVDVPHRLPGIQSALGTGDVGDRRIELDAEQPEYRRCKSATTDAVYRTPYDGSREDERRAFEALRRATEAEHSPPHALATAADLDELVAEIQEDVVLMRRDTDAVTPGSARAVYLNVCFPTGWCPACMNGRAFTAIHGPVPALHDFPGGRGRGEWETYLLDTARGATVRFVWTLTPDDALDRRRCEKGHRRIIATPWSEATRAYLRVERQVLLPLSATLGIFLIRVYRYDVTQLEPGQRRRLWQSIAAMEPALAKYKGFAGNERVLHRLLGVD